jgi:hypothetical protein
MLFVRSFLLFLSLSTTIVSSQTPTTDTLHADAGGFFDLDATHIEGHKVDLHELAGEITVITNVASQCGFTDAHYRGLNELQSHFAEDAVVSIFVRSLQAYFTIESK